MSEVKMSEAGRSTRSSRKRKSSNSGNHEEDDVSCEVARAQLASRVKSEAPSSSGTGGEAIASTSTAGTGIGAVESSAPKSKSKAPPQIFHGSSIVPEVVKITKALENKLAMMPEECIPLFHFEEEDKAPKLERDENATVQLPRRKITDEDRNESVVKGIPDWELIVEELTKLKDLEKDNGEPFSLKVKQAISSYNPREAENSNFDMLDDPDLPQALVQTLPTIVDHCLALVRRLKCSIPLLKRGTSQTLYLTRNLCCSLLANAFFSTFPDQGNPELPDFNFSNLFNREDSPAKCGRKLEKLKCIIKYFHGMREDRGEDDGRSIISFERRCVREKQDWANSDKKLSGCQVVVKNKGEIHDEKDVLQMDFANNRIGGEILKDGLLKEEIRFLISPELIVARLFTEDLDDDEVLVVTGTRQFSNYTGFKTTFQYKKLKRSEIEVSKTDEFGRESVEVVAADPLRKDSLKQYPLDKIDRELHKCFVAFKENCDRPVATGNWGCGSLNGDPELKFLIQWLAAAHLGRSAIHFYTDNDPVQGKLIEEIVKVMEEDGATVGKVYKLLARHGERFRTTSVYKILKKECRPKTYPSGTVPLI